MGYLDWMEIEYQELQEEKEALELSYLTGEDPDPWCDSILTDPFWSVIARELGRKEVE